jgi:hypothetical protein
MVTAKFKVSRVSPMGADNIDDAWATEIEMTPDYAGGANHEWSVATPAGVCRLTITNKAAIEKLPLGASLTLTFSVDD